jgi:exodeoxyribonuclease III
MEVSFYSFNVNGLRAAIKKGFIDWLIETKPDVLCLQEIKVTPDQIDLDFLSKLGYDHFWFPAIKRGYSGVAVFSKIKPDFVSLGMNYHDYDSEGRILRTDFGNVTHLGVYFPSGTRGDTRQSFKMKFLDDFDQYISALKIIRPNIIISGDINIAHKEIDINFPKKHNKMSGFLPEERTWVDHFLAKGFTDSFRVFHKEGEQYSWWSYRANSREKNLGWRIDYQFITDTLKTKLKSASIHANIVQSDHCPISIVLDL